MNDDVNARQIAQDGLQRVEEAILKLLDSNPQGLRNTQVADLLDLRSDFRGRQRDYLTYSVLGGLIAKGKAYWDQQTKIFSRV